jgi:hypothetical protein
MAILKVVIINVCMGTDDIVRTAHAGVYMHMAVYMLCHACQGFAEVWQESALMK